MTNIPYLDKVWNVTRGCTKVSAGCKNCYAERNLQRFYPDEPDFDVKCPVVTLDAQLDKPLHWRKPRRIGVCFMSDLFHEAVPDEFLDKVFAVMALTPQHIYLVLTKRPERMRDYLVGLASDVQNWPLPTEKGSERIRVATIVRSVATWPLPNVWLGVSVENQQAADERIPLLLEIPAAHRWVSVEPLLEAVDLHPGNWIAPLGGGPRVNFLHPEIAVTRPTLDWVVVGGESGPKARPCEVVWIADIVAQCQAASVSVYVKQDSNLRPGQQWRIPDALWAVKMLPEGWK